MLKAIKRAFGSAAGEAHALAGHERHQLHLAVAILLHEARRADVEEARDESDVGVQALVEIFGLEPRDAAALLEEGRAKAQQLTSFYAPVSVIKREFSQEERIHLMEHLWRVSFADGNLHLHEDQYVRKIAHLLYVPNTQNMLARNRARAAGYRPRSA
jgi:uncharacterized tellurite resistance protein B-like protein